MHKLINSNLYTNYDLRDLRQRKHDLQKFTSKSWEQELRNPKDAFNKWKWMDGNYFLKFGVAPPLPLSLLLPYLQLF